MFRIYLKHFIYEKCIDVLFDGIFNNFIISENKEFKVGDQFESIRALSSNIHTTLYNCNIMDNMQGTVLIQYRRSTRVFESGIISYDESGIPVVWRVNTENIKSYIRR